MPDGSTDVVISNGVINLAPDKVPRVRGGSAPAAQGGRLAIADIVADSACPRRIVCNADLWAACIGGAAQQDDYRAAIETAGLRVERVEENPSYQFISDRAKRASRKYGVKSSIA